MSWLSFLERRRAGSPVTGESAAFSPTAQPNGYEHRSGLVTWMSAKTRYCVHLRISGFDQLVELRCTQHWAIQLDDVLDILGRPDLDSGKFIARAYYNRNQRILDATHVNLNLDMRHSFGLLEFAMAATPIGVSAIFVAAKIYLPLIFLLPFTAVWLALLFLFWTQRNRRPSWLEKLEKEDVAWKAALAVFRQNVGGAP